MRIAINPMCAFLLSLSVVLLFIFPPHNLFRQNSWQRYLADASTQNDTKKKPFQQQHNKESQFKREKKKVRVAIIGGAISGSFVAKYLTDYDLHCTAIESITVFDPYVYFSTVNSSDNDDREKIDTESTIYPYFYHENANKHQSHFTEDSMNSTNKPEQQGGRVATLILKDNTTVVELGASILYEGNKLVVDMIRNDPSLSMGEPHTNLRQKPQKLDEMSPQQERNDDKSSGRFKTGLGIYNGKSNSTSRWPLLITSDMSSFAKMKAMLWRYHIDLYRIKRASDKALESFQRIYDLLDDSSSPTTATPNLFHSPEDIWNTVGLSQIAHCSMDQLLDRIGFSKPSFYINKKTDPKYFESDFINHTLYPYYSKWKKLMQQSFDLLRGRSPFREEFLTAINLCNNNKNNAQMTGLAGLVNFVASRGPLFSIVGGNYKLIQSAFQQANNNRRNTCSAVTTKHVEILFRTERVKTVLCELHEGKGIQLFAGDGISLGNDFDIVILAAPLQFADIDFLVKGSLFDSGVLYPMPLNGKVLVHDKDVSDANRHGHKQAFETVPRSATRPYTQVITTIVSNATLQGSVLYFDYDGNNSEKRNQVPSSIIFTEKGKGDLSGISAITQLSEDGVYKLFSSSPLDLSYLEELFGQFVKVDFVKVWGGINGGATPNFNGGASTDSPPFLLFDHNDGMESFDGPALYYINGIETTVSAIEISAIGAKAVAKLIASRLDLLRLNNFDTALGTEL